MPEPQQDEIGGSELEVGWTFSAVIEDMLVKQHPQGMDGDAQHQGSLVFGVVLLERVIGSEHSSLSGGNCLYLLRVGYRNQVNCP